jgi:phosphate/sulfate permease
MNKIKQILAVIWFLLGMYAGYFSITSFGLPKFLSGIAGNTSDLVFGIIMLFILTPIIVGALCMFCFYALRGDYNTKHNPLDK